MGTKEIETELEDVKNRLDNLEKNVGLCFNNTDLLKDIIEYLEESTIDELIKEIKEGIVNENNNKLKEETKKNATKRETEQ